MAHDELLQAARRYYGDDQALVVEEDENVVRPRNYIDPRGCTAVQIDAEGRWHEGWWSPDEPFRRI
jgi:hypothetical protein